MTKLLTGKKALIYAVSTLAAAALVSGAVIYVVSKDKTPERDRGEARIEEDAVREEEGYRDPLTGERRGNATSTRPVAVMIENHVDARPLSGVSQASLVFEVPVEGGITRLLAVFDPERAVKEIGPVRSARPYYLDWAGELDAMYCHVGGSPDALAKISSGSVRDLNQYFWGKYYWRSGSRYAPHNVYTSTELMREALEVRDWRSESAFGSWAFEEAASSTVATSTSEISVPFSSPSYSVRWRWDPLRGSYLRSIGTTAASDRDGSRQVARNVAVAFVGTEVLDEVGRLGVQTVGSGGAMMFRDGEATLGTWKKPDSGSRLRFYSEDGEEFVWRPGSTWIEIVPNGITVTMTRGEETVSADGTDK